MARNIAAIKRGGNYDRTNTRLQNFVDGLEAIRLTPSSTGVDVRFFGDTPATYYIDFDASGPTLTLANVNAAVGGTLAVTGTSSFTGQVTTPVVPNVNTTGGIVNMHRLAITNCNTALTRTASITLVNKERIMNGWVVKTDANQGNNGTCTVTAYNSGSAVTDSLSIQNKSDKAITYFTQIDDAKHEVNSGAVLSVTVTHPATADDCACIVYLLGIVVS